jgi:hypothetical protein
MNPPAAASLAINAEIDAAESKPVNILFIVASRIIYYPNLNDIFVKISNTKISHSWRMRAEAAAPWYGRNAARGA